MASAFGRNYLGYELRVAPGGVVKRGVSREAKKAFKQRIRWLTRRSGGRSMEEVARKLRQYLLGWKGYFGHVQTLGVFARLDEWIRHRLRAIQLKQWKRGTTVYRELKRLGCIGDDSPSRGGQHKAVVA